MLMGDIIKLEYYDCPACGMSLRETTSIIRAYEGRVGILCPACKEFIGLTMKGGDYYKEGASTGEVETRHPEDLTTNTKED